MLITPSARTARRMLMENVRIHNVAYGIYRPTFDNQVFKNLHLSQAGGEPFNRGMDDASAQGGSISVDGLRIDDIGGNDQRHPAVHMTDNNLSGKAECHFRNVVVTPPSTKGGQPGPRGTRPAFNRGGTVRVDPFVDKGVPYYIHDYFGPGRHAKIVSTKAADLLKDGNEYRQELAVDRRRIGGRRSEGRGLAPASQPRGRSAARDHHPVGSPPGGQAAGQGRQPRQRRHPSVTVNGQDATIASQSAGVADWRIELTPPAGGKLSALAADDAGNAEKTPHEMVLEAAQVAHNLRQLTPAGAIMKRRTFVQATLAAAVRTPLLAALRQERLDEAADVLAKATASGQVAAAVLHVAQRDATFTRAFGKAKRRRCHVPAGIDLQADLHDGPDDAV